MDKVIDVIQGMLLGTALVLMAVVMWELLR